MSTPNFRDLDRNPRPDAPDPKCGHRHKTQWPNLKTLSGAAVYQCRDCGKMVTALGVQVFNPQESSHD